MDPVVKKTVCCVGIISTVAALTFTCVIIAKKPEKHEETFNNIHREENDPQTVKTPIDTDHNIIDLDHGKQTHGTLPKEPKNETLDHPNMAAVNHNEESGVKSSSAESSGSSTTSHAEMSDEQQKHVHPTQFDLNENDRVKVLNQTSSNVSNHESTDLNHYNQTQSPSDKQTNTFSEEPINDQQQNAEVTDVNNPISEASTEPPVVNVENQSLSQASNNLSVNVPTRKDLNVINQNIESCSTNTQEYTLNDAEKQYIAKLAAVIVETVDLGDIGTRVAKGKVFKRLDSKLTVLSTSEVSVMFKINLNGKDLMLKYVKDKSKMPNEAQITAEARHENIVEVYHTLHTNDDKGFFIVMEAMDCDLLEWKKTHPDAIKDIVRSVVSALEYLHGKGIAHCGLKLENILVKTVNNKPVFKLSNFIGAVYTDKNKMIESSFCLATDEYEAPESNASGEYQKETDIWQLGHVIWYYIKSPDIFYIENDKFDIGAYEDYIYEPQNCLLIQDRPEIINKCCTDDPKKRASLNTILQWCNEEDPKKE